MTSLEIVDTTLRDGSCAIDYRYGEDDVRAIAGGLAASGVGWIEVGHGVSAGIVDPSFARPTVSDERTLEIAREHARGARIGAVVVPALTTPELFERLLPLLDFVRLAPAPSLLAGAAPYVRAATRCGVEVFLQLVKTHVYEKDRIADEVRPLVDQGLDAVYVVDSAGCMQAAEVTGYIDVLRDAFALPVGFHGHDNTSLALSNSLAAAAAGASFVDGTLGGIGRGAGNMQLELFVSCMQSTRDGCEAIAVDRLFELSHALAQRFPEAARGIDALEAYYAVHRWDSLSKEAVVAAASAIGVSPFVFIRSLAGRASGPWITRQDIDDTTRLLQADVR